MFKPNIRGYPRGSFRMGLDGWQIQDQPGVVLRYRFAWRKAWSHQLNQDPQAQVLIARDGRVHILALKEPRQSLLPKSKIFILAFAAAVVALVVGWSAAGENLVKVPGAASSADSSSVTVSAQPDCKQLLERAKSTIENWSNGKLVSPLTVTESNPLVMGGVKSSLLQVGCERFAEGFRATWINRNSEWVLKNLTQLEN